MLAVSVKKCVGGGERSKKSVKKVSYETDEGEMGADGKSWVAWFRGWGGIWIDCGCLVWGLCWGLCVSELEW